MKYYQLNLKSRQLIQYLYNEERLSITKISERLKINKSTISREIKRNSNFGIYDAEIANKKALNRHSHKYFFNNMKYAEFTNLFLEFFEKNFFGINATYHWIEVKFPKVKKPCLRQIFNLINSCNWIITPKDRLHAKYRKGGIYRLSLSKRIHNKYVFPILLRPKSTNLREFYGDWEVDLIIGSKYKNHDHLLTFVERCSRKVFIVKVKNKNPFKINSVIKKLVETNKLYVRSITSDNGFEFNKIGILAKWLNCKVYYCNPYASYQRGSNENINGLVRRLYKKGTNFNEISDQEIYELQEKINNMLCKILWWKSSNEKFSEIAN